MKNVLLCQHGGSGNHGCEALARTVDALVRTAQPDAEVTLYSYSTEQDMRYLGDETRLDIRGFSEMPGRFSSYNFIYHAKRALKMRASKIPMTREFKSLVDGSDIVLAIGGDNYCYNQGRGYWLIDEHIRSCRKKYMLLGCSIEPHDLKLGLGEHLKLFDCITVRESISFAAMRDYGLRNIELIPDSAFLLAAGEAKLPVGFTPENAVGLNLSPLVMKNESIPGMTVKNFENLARFILYETDMQIALIPHVVWGGNDDRDALARLREVIGGGERVFTIADAKASDLKCIISRLRFFVGARTHATIAAYSSCVPTLTLGYSVKARGIARDLFGQEQGYVIGVQSLSDEDELLSAFRDVIMRDEISIRARLQAIMPGYKAQAATAANIIKERLNG